MKKLKRLTLNKEVVSILGGNEMNWLKGGTYQPIDATIVVSASCQVSCNGTCVSCVTCFDTCMPTCGATCGNNATCGATCTVCTSVGQCK